MRAKKVKRNNDKGQKYWRAEKIFHENGKYFFYIQCGPEQNQISKNI